MKASKIRIDIPGTLGKPPYWLCEVSEDWEYKGKDKTDTLLGYRYVTAIPEMGLERITVKIPGKKLIELSEGEIAEVDFENLDLKLYGLDKRQVGLSARATGIFVVPGKND